MWITRSAGEGFISWQQTQRFFHCWTCDCILILLQVQVKPAESSKWFLPADLSKKKKILSPFLKNSGLILRFLLFTTVGIMCRTPPISNRARTEKYKITKDGDFLIQIYSFHWELQKQALQGSFSTRGTCEQFVMWLLKPGSKPKVNTKASSSMGHDLASIIMLQYRIKSRKINTESCPSPRFPV